MGKSKNSSTLPCMKKLSDLTEAEKDKLITDVYELIAELRLIIKRCTRLRLTAYITERITARRLHCVDNARHSTRLDCSSYVYRTGWTIKPLIIQSFGALMTHDYHERLNLYLYPVLNW